MLIRVMYDDGRFDMVKPELLDKLLNSRKVSSFKRLGGWAVVGRDPVRSKRRDTDYKGPERRAA
jgi:hypothetical protein